MKKVFIVLCVLVILTMGSMSVFADPKAEPGTEISVSPTLTVFLADMPSVIELYTDPKATLGTGSIVSDYFRWAYAQ